MTCQRISPRWLTYGLLYGPICLFHWRILVLRELPNGGDMLNQFIPWRRFALQCLSEGYLPLWNPYVFCGTPFWANIQTALLFPWNVLHLFVDVPLFFALCLVIHHCIAAGSMYAFFRNRCDSHLAALVAATIYAWSGFFILHANDGHWIHIQAYAYIPLALLAQDRLRPGFSWLRLSALAGALTMMILAGHLQLPLYVFYLLVFRGVWYAVFLSADARGLTEKTKPLLWTVAGIALCLLLCAAVVIPLLQLARHSSTRARGTPYVFATHDSLPPAHLLTLLAPFLYGDPTRPEPDQRFWETTTGYHEICGYAGVVPLVLALIAFVPARGRAGRENTETAAERRFALALLAIALALSLGRYTPLYRIPYHLLPGFAYFRVPGRLVLFYGLAVAILAGHGVRRLLAAPWWEEKNRPSVMIPFGTGCLLALASLLVILNREGIWNLLHHIEVERSRQALGLPPTAYEAVAARIPGFLIDGRLRHIVNGTLAATGLFWLGLLGAGLTDRWRNRPARSVVLLWLLVFGDLLWFSHRFISTFPRDEWIQRHYPETPVISLLGTDRHRALFTDEIVIGRGIPRHQECKHNRPLQFGIRAVRGYDPIQLGSFASFINRIQGRDPATPQGGMLYIPRARDIQPRGLELTAVKYIVTTHDVPDFAHLVWADPYSPLRVYSLPDAPPDIRLLDADTDAVKILADRPGLLEVRASPAKPTHLFWSQCWYPGWEVTVDGVPQEVDLMEGVFFRVPVSAGEHVVRFAFRPWPVYLGLALTFATLATLSAFCIAERWKRSRWA